MNAHVSEHRDYGFIFGLLTGTCVGAGLAMWLAPRLSSELRQRMADSAKNIGTRAADQYDQASARVVQVVSNLTRKGQDVRDEVADAVARGAHEVRALRHRRQERPRRRASGSPNRSHTRGKRRRDDGRSRSRRPRRACRADAA